MTIDQFSEFIIKHKLDMCGSMEVKVVVEMEGDYGEESLSIELAYVFNNVLYLVTKANGRSSP